MSGFWKIKSRGSTLVEIMVALVIVSLTFALSSSLWIKVSKVNNAIALLRAVAMVDWHFKAGISSEICFSSDTGVLPNDTIRVTRNAHPVLADCLLTQISVLTSTGEVIEFITIERRCQ